MGSSASLWKATYSFGFLLAKMLIDETLYVRRTETQNSAAPSEPDGRDPGLAPGRMIPHPILRHLQKFRDFVERPKPWRQFRRREQAGLWLARFETSDQLCSRFLHCSVIPREIHWTVSSASSAGLGKIS